ncbi:MAG: hypothetical protein FD174_3459 [Geobacteraceae bacterium]|nr:MAG: hypothetical protein FD174_3459 [Geobacteraceae bacterium]
MNKCGIFFLSLLLFFCTLTVTAAQAEENAPAAPAGKPEAPAADKETFPPWSASVESAWLPESGSRDVGGKVGMEEVEVKLGRTHVVTPRLSLLTELGYSLRHISAPAGARLPEELHALTASLGSNYQATKSLALNFLVAPGLRSDFKAIGADDLRVLLAFLGRYSPSEKLTLLAGLIYLEGYRSVPFLPIAGAIYRPDEHWTISLAAPRPGVSYAPDRTKRFYIGGEFAGGEYQLHDAALGAKIINYSNFRAFAGAGFTLFSAVNVNLSGGYAFARRFAFFDGFRKDINVDDAPFARLGVKVDW